MTLSKPSVLSGNMLKLIGAAFMVCDHIGMILFHEITILRILGRIAFPIFAFFIAEGCRYTKNKLRYFLSLFLCGVICQTVFYFYGGSLEMCIFVTFSLSIINIYALQLFKNTLASDKSPIKKALSALPFAAALCATWTFNQILDIDYGFFGCILPVFAAILHTPKGSSNKAFKVLDKIPFHALMTAIGLIPLGIERGGIQIFGLLAVPFLLLYSGKRGRLKMKYFFYLFYPAHLVIIELVGMLVVNRL